MKRRKMWLIAVPSEGTEVAFDDEAIAILVAASVRRAGGVDVEVYEVDVVAVRPVAGFEREAAPR